MEEYGKHELHSGSKTGPKVTKPSQARAIAYSEQKRADRQRRQKSRRDEALRKRIKQA